MRSATEDYAAVITAQAGALRKLTNRGRDVIVPFPEAGPIPDYRGIVAAPWPNRIADGFYNFDGEYLHLPVNEPERGCALHGLAFNRDWSVTHLDERSVTLAIEVEPSEGYPFSLQIETAYTTLRRLSDRRPRSGAFVGRRFCASARHPGMGRGDRATGPPRRAPALGWALSVWRGWLR